MKENQTQSNTYGQTMQLKMPFEGGSPHCAYAPLNVRKLATMAAVADAVLCDART